MSGLALRKLTLPTRRGITEVYANAVGRSAFMAFEGTERPRGVRFSANNRGAPPGLPCHTNSSFLESLRRSSSRLVVRGLVALRRHAAPAGGGQAGGLLEPAG